jgi:5-methylcytosine-specific restriction endonuclease McrA
MRLTIPAKLRVQVRTQDENRCAYCRTPEELTVTTFEIDHIVPISAGGETELDNLCLACPACNRHKGSRRSATDPETGEAVPLYHPRQQDWSGHFAWSPDNDQITGSTPTGRATVEALNVNRPQLVRLRRLWAHLGYDLGA